MEVLGLVDIPWWALLIALIVILLSYSSRDFDFFRKQGITGRRPLPIIGTMYTLLGKDLPSVLLESLELSRQKGCIGGFMGSKPVLAITDEEMLSQVMVKDFPTFTNRWGIENGSLTDKMLLVLKGDHWKHVRNEMTPSFSTGKLKKMNIEINRCAKSLADSLMEPAKSGEIAEMTEYTGGYTMDVIASTAFGIRVNSQKDRNNSFVIHARKAFDVAVTNPLVLLRLILPPLDYMLTKFGFRFENIPKDTQEFFYDITRQTLDMRKDDVDQSRSDFLQLMLNAQKGENFKDEDEEGNHQVPKHQDSGSGLSTDEILANAMLFFVAGYDTTSTTLSFFLYNMALYPDCQAKLIDEIEQIAGNKDFVDYGLTQEMPYLDQCTNETLRLYPPAML